MVMARKSPLESVVQRKAIKWMEDQGHYVIKITLANKSGTPDLIVCTMNDGKFFAIEVKRKGLKRNVTKIQQHHINLINKTGGKAIVADCLEDVQALFGMSLDFLD